MSRLGTGRGHLEIEQFKIVESRLGSLEMGSTCGCVLMVS